MAFPGFNNKKHSTISSGDWDRDGVMNRKDCEPLNWKKQGSEHEKEWNIDKLSERRAKQLANDLGLYAYKKVNGYWALE